MEVPQLTLDELRVLVEQLDEGDLEQTLLLLKLFIVLCRWVPALLPKVGELGTAGHRGHWHISVTSPIIHSPGTWRMWRQAGAGCWCPVCWHYCPGCWPR